MKSAGILLRAAEKGIRNTEEGQPAGRMVLPFFVQKKFFGKKYFFSKIL